MLRCPFNNFSKCDGSCPFSMPDFVSCRLSTALIAIEGVCRGQLAQAVTTNAHLTELRGMVEEMHAEPDAEKERKQLQRASKMDACYLYRCERKDGTVEMEISLNNDATARVLESFGTKVDVLVVQSTKTFIIAPGTRFTVSKNSGGCRSSVSVGRNRGAIEMAFGKAHYTYLEPTFEGGMLRLTVTGEVE